MRSGVCSDQPIVSVGKALGRACGGMCMCRRCWNMPIGKPSDPLSSQNLPSPGLVDASESCPRRSLLDIIGPH